MIVFLPPATTLLVDLWSIQNITQSTKTFIRVETYNQARKPLGRILQIPRSRAETRDIHYRFLLEAYVLNLYRADLLRKNDVVLDAGAGIGEFTVLASKKIGPEAK